MPIYAYRCSACGHAQDVLQKLSDPRLTTCPECGRDTYEKQVTAAGFRLKGTGWYATDFRGGSPSDGAGPASDHHDAPAGDSSASAKPAPTKSTPASGAGPASTGKASPTSSNTSG
ncbi:MAG: zinc ribbon domain-containing protein [Alcaligenaceae bacterium]|nr:zinc ribbon domain-containing protein [Alcaligenaceae bacterium]